jgi:hypothetical protein
VKHDEYSEGKKMGIIEFSSQMSIDIHKRIAELGGAGMTGNALKIIFDIKDRVQKRLLKEAVE